MTIQEKVTLLEKGLYQVKYGFCIMKDEGYQSFVKLYVTEDNNTILLAEPFTITNKKDGSEELYFYNREWESYYLDSCSWIESEQQLWKKHFGE